MACRPALWWLLAPTVLAPQTPPAPAPVAGAACDSTPVVIGHVTVVGIGAAAVAAFAALCCVGPWAVAVLGVSGAIAAASLAPYRLPLLLTSLAVLAFGFWRAYGRRAIVGGRSCRVRVGRFSRTALWVAAAVWLAAALLPSS